MRALRRILGGGTPPPTEFLATYHGARKWLHRSAGALRAELRPDETPTCIAAGHSGVVAVTPERVIEIAAGAVRAAFDRVVITSIAVEEGHVTFAGVDGLLLVAEVSDPRRVADAAAPVPLLTRHRRAQLDRLGREAFTGDFRLVEPSGPDIVLEAARIMGLADPSPLDPRWRVFETRLCAELLRTEGWALAGALVVVDAIDTARRHPLGLELIDRATAFLDERGVPARSLPYSARDRWVALNGWTDCGEPLELAGR